MKPPITKHRPFGWDLTMGLVGLVLGTIISVGASLIMRPLGYTPVRVMVVIFCLCLIIGIGLEQLFRWLWRRRGQLY